MVVVAFATFIVWFRMKGSWFKIGTTFSEGLGLGSLRSRDQALKGSERGRLSLSLSLAMEENGWMLEQRAKPCRSGSRQHCLTNKAQQLTEEAG